MHAVSVKFFFQRAITAYSDLIITALTAIFKLVELKIVSAHKECLIAAVTGCNITTRFAAENYDVCMRISLSF